MATAILDSPALAGAGLGAAVVALTPLPRAIGDLTGLSGRMAGLAAAAALGGAMMASPFVMPSFATVYLATQSIFAAGGGAIVAFVPPDRQRMVGIAGAALAAYSAYRLYQAVEGVEKK